MRSITCTSPHENKKRSSQHTPFMTFYLSPTIYDVNNCMKYFILNLAFSASPVLSSSLILTRFELISSLHVIILFAVCKILTPSLP